MVTFFIVHLFSCMIIISSLSSFLLGYFKMGLFCFEILLSTITDLVQVYQITCDYLCYLFLEERIISRFGSIIVELFWYYCCTITGILHTANKNFFNLCFCPQLMFFAEFFLNHGLLCLILLKNLPEFLFHLLYISLEIVTCLAFLFCIRHRLCSSFKKHTERGYICFLPCCGQ